LKIADSYMYVRPISETAQVRQLQWITSGNRIHTDFTTRYDTKE